MTRAELEARIAEKKAQLAAANATYLALLGEKSKNFEVRTPEGQHVVDKRSLTEMKKAIDALESDIKRDEMRLNGLGISRFSAGW